MLLTTVQENLTAEVRYLHFFRVVLISSKDRYGLRKTVPLLTFRSNFF